MILVDFFQFSIQTKEYGELFFITYPESEKKEALEKIKANITNDDSSLCEEIFDTLFTRATKNTIEIKSIDKTKLSKEELFDFSTQFFNKQFCEYVYNPELSWSENIKQGGIHQQKISEQQEKEIQDSFISKIDMSLALSGNSVSQLSQLISNPIRDMQEQLERNLRPYSTVFANIGQTFRMETMPSFTEYFYPSLSEAVDGIKNAAGQFSALIKPTIKSFSEQLDETLNELSISRNLYNNALSCIPDNFSISRIYKDAFENINIYVKNTEKEDEPEYNINNTIGDKGFIDFLHDIPKEDVIRFVTHLQEFPYLALLDEVGKKIFDAVQTNIKKYVVLEENKTFYRARAKKSGAPDWTYLQIGQPQYGIPGMGRFNFLGSPLFYVTTEIETAKKEVQTLEKPESTVMKLKQNKGINVFDISTENCPLVSYCNMDKQSGNDYTAYLVPNFLSVCCAYLNKQNRHSVDAIKYRSNESEGGYCYVILDKTPLDFFEDGIIVNESE